MSTRQALKRVGRLEERVCPEHDGSYTLEELARMLWTLDRKKYLGMANEGSSYPLRFFLSQFEREDAERAARR